MAERVNHRGVITRLAIKRRLGISPAIHAPPKRRRGRRGASPTKTPSKDMVSSKVESVIERSTNGQKIEIDPNDEDGGFIIDERMDVEEDELLLDALPPEDPWKLTQQMKDEILPEVLNHPDFYWIWEKIRTKYRVNKLGTLYQFRIPALDSHTMTDVKSYIRTAFDHFGKPAKMSVHCSYLIHNRDTDEYRFFWQVSILQYYYPLYLNFRVKIQ